MTGAAVVDRLETVVDIPAGGPDPRSVSFSALHRAVLADGRRLVLLDDRGWTSSWSPDVPPIPSVEEIEDTARVVVGPDEPFGEHTQADMENDHWRALVDVLAQQAVAVDAHELRRLPHDVVLSARLQGLVQS
jgi:hypothetical protein